MDVAPGVCPDGEGGDDDTPFGEGAAVGVGAAMGVRPGGNAAPLAGGGGADGGVDAPLGHVSPFPSNFECPLLQEPPYDPVYWDIRGANGSISEQGFSHNELLRHILYRGVGRARNKVKHPLNGGWISRANAQGRIRPVSEDVLDRIRRERRERDPPLPLEVNNALTKRENQLLEETVRLSAEQG